MKWKSSNDEPPEEGQHVLFYKEDDTPYGGSPEVRPALIMKGEAWWFGNDYGRRHLGEWWTEFEFPGEKEPAASSPSKKRGCNLCAATMQAAKAGKLKEDADCLVCMTSYKKSKIK